MNSINWKEVRSAYPIFESRVYLRTNGGGPLSKHYITALNEVVGDASSQGRLWEKYWGYQQDVRRLIASLFNCEKEEVALSQSVSLAMNHFAAMLPDTKKVVTFQDEYPSNTIPWLERGFSVSFIASDEVGYIAFADIESAIKDADILIVSHVEYKTGFRHDLVRIGALCRKLDVVLIVDATQSAGVIPIDFKATGADAIVFSAHKWMNAGYGVACMIVKKSFIVKYPPAIVGWKGVDYNENSDYKVREDASVFELGHPDFIAIFSLLGQLRFIDELGIENMYTRIESLRSYFDQLCSKNGIKIINLFANENRSGIVALKSKDSATEKFGEAGVDLTVRGDTITAAISYYNNNDDLDALAGLLEA